MPADADKPDPQEELGHVLEELRVMLPGVEILFAFLLTVPFTERFSEITTRQTYIYFAAFFTAALAVAFLIAPSTLHRIQRHPDSMERLLRTSTILSIVGAFCMAIAITAVVYLITELIYDYQVGAIFTAIIAGVLSWFWFGLPLWHRLR
jgi:amino acid transporter